MVTDLSTNKTTTAAIAAAMVSSLRGATTKAVAPSTPAAEPTLSTFAGALEDLVSSNDELRRLVEETMARSARQALAFGDGALPSTADFVNMLQTQAVAGKGGTVARAFWWGFHIQISHEDLDVFLASAQPINAIIGAIGGGIPSPAAPFIAIAAGFIAGALALLKGLDRGKGVYVSMSWFAPGVFVPTTVV